MIDEADPYGGLARAALVLTTAIIAEVRRNRLTAQQARRIFQQARFLVDDRESFAANQEAAEAAGQHALHLASNGRAAGPALDPPCTSTENLV